MPPIPEVTQTITDGALGVANPSFARVQAKIGVCSAGTPNTVAQFSDPKQMQDALGRGAVTEAAAQAMKQSPVLIVPVTPTVVGSIGSTSLVGSGTGTVVGGKVPDRLIRIKIVLGGALGTMTFQVSIGAAAYGAVVTSQAVGPPFPYRIPGAPLVVANFGAGTYIAADIYTFNLDGTIVRTGTGPATALDTSTFENLDTYDVKVRITTAGGLGVGVFQHSMDGGDNYSAQILVPSGGIYPVPGTGVKLTFAGTFVKDDVYSFKTVGPSCSNSDVATAMDALLADPRKWFLVHVVVSPTSAANSASLAATVDAKLSAAEGNFRYARGLIECPHDADIGGSVNDAAVIAAFAAYGNTRIGVGVGDMELVSLLTGRSDRRNVAWTYAARLSAIQPGEDASWVGRGALPGVVSLYRDESTFESLNDQRFVTARTHIGKEGFYITKDKMMAPSGSDFGNMTRCRVMDIACDTTRARLLQYLNSSVRVDKKTGFIDERDAQRIEADVTAVLRAAIVATGDATDATVLLNRTTNILTTSTEPVTTRIIPLGYLEFITNDLGFLNPALAA